MNVTSVFFGVQAEDEEQGIDARRVERHDDVRKPQDPRNVAVVEVLNWLRRVRRQIEGDTSDTRYRWISRWDVLPTTSDQVQRRRAGTPVGEGVADRLDVVDCLLYTSPSPRD